MPMTQKAREITEAILRDHQFRYEATKLMIKDGDEWRRSSRREIHSLALRYDDDPMTSTIRRRGQIAESIIDRARVEWLRAVFPK